MIPDELYADVKRVASDLGKTVTAVVEEGLHDVVRRYTADPGEPGRPGFRFQGIDTGELLPGVDLYSNAALADVMDSLT